MLLTSFLKLFLLDLLTVSETANDVTFDEGNGINSPTNLGLEATFINQNFSQQCLKRGPDKKVFANPNPFITDEDEGQVASVAYRYFKLTHLFKRYSKNATISQTKNTNKIMNAVVLYCSMLHLLLEELVLINFLLSMLYCRSG